MIRFFVPGNPKTLKRHRSYTTRKGIHVNVDPNKTDKMDFLAKAIAHKPDEPIEGAVCVRLIAVFPRPKAHYRTGRHANLLKDSAPFWHTSTPDLDNVLKFIGDALNGIFWKDDRTICNVWIAGVYGRTPGIAVEVWTPELDDVSRTMDCLSDFNQERRDVEKTKDQRSAPGPHVGHDN